MEAADTTAKTQAPDTPSLPLYLAGGVIALCGIFAANAALPQSDPGWMGRTVLLTALGFVFSYGSRRLGIKSQVVDLGVVAVLLLLLAGIVGGQIVLEQFLPVGADSPNLFILSGLVWGGTIWAWALGSDNRVLLSAVPAMGVLGLAASVDQNDPVKICFGVFILTVIFLLIHQNYLQNRVRAAAEARAAVPARLLLAQLTQTGLCGLAVLLAGSVVIVPAQAVFSRLSLTQAIRRLAAGRPVPGSAALRFSDDDNLQIGTGAAWSSSAAVVMQVTPSDGLEHYWRGRTYDLYTGAGWQSSLEDRKDRAGDEGLASGGDRESYGVRSRLTPGDRDEAAAPLTATFRVLGETGQFYYAANPRHVLLGVEAARYAQGVQVCDDGRLDLVSGGPVRSPYQVVSAPVPDAARPETQDRLRRAGTDYPPEVRHLYLSATGEGITQPEDSAFFRQAVADAVQSLPPDRRDPLDEALVLRDWVSRRCVYSLAPPPIPSEDDHVRVFLNDARRGYCDMFASSLAILCRTAGIPARLATGFAPGDPSADGGFNLRGEDKHAWTEVYFPGTGWVALDATAGAATDGSVPRAGGTGRAGWRAWLQRLRAGLGAGWGLVAPLLAGVALIVGYVLKTELYDRWRASRPASSRAPSASAQAPRSALGRRYARLARALARLGLARRPSETPDEYAARVTPLLPTLEREFGVALSLPLVPALTAAFAQACYERPAALTGGVEKWDDALARFEAASWRVFGIRLWRRVLHPGVASPKMIVGEK